MKNISLTQVIKILDDHSIDGIFDDSTGSSLAGDLGVHEEYRLDDVRGWLGY